MKTIALALLALAAALPLGAAGEDEASPPAAADVIDLLKLDGERARAVARILDRAADRDQAVEAQFGDTRDAASRALQRFAKLAIRQDAEQQLDAILSGDEMTLLRLMAPARPPAFGPVRFVGM